MIQSLKYFLVLSYFLSQVVSGEEVIKGVRYWKPDSSFSESSDIYIKDKTIVRIIPSKQDSIRFLIPSFCDAYVTLGANSIGGQNDLSSVKVALRSLLSHGFTHVLSVADGPWINKIKSEIDSGKLLGPEIFIADRPLIPKSSELKDVSEFLYFVADKQSSMLEEANKQILGRSPSLHIFNRFNPDSNFSIDSSFLNQLRQVASEKNKTITVHTFGDRISILDSLISGNRYLIHPILYEMQNEISQQHIDEIKLIPILNVYKNFYFTNEEGGQGFEELNFLKKKDNFFVSNYSVTYEENLNTDIDTEEINNRKSEYQSYTKFIEKNPNLKKNIILGSGSGYRLSFPGVSGIQELKILERIYKSKEELIRIASQNSCIYIGTGNKGQIKMGEEANLLVLRENPMNNLDTLFAIEQVYKKGKLILFETPKKKKR